MCCFVDSITCLSIDLFNNACIVVKIKSSFLHVELTLEKIFTMDKWKCIYPSLQRTSSFYAYATRDVLPERIIYTNIEHFFPFQFIKIINHMKYSSCHWFSLLTHTHELSTLLTIQCLWFSSFLVCLSLHSQRKITTSLGLFYSHSASTQAV